MVQSLSVLMLSIAVTRVCSCACTHCVVNCTLVPSCRWPRLAHLPGGPIAWARKRKLPGQTEGGGGSHQHDALPEGDECLPCFNVRRHSYNLMPASDLVRLWEQDASLRDKFLELRRTIVRGDNVSVTCPRAVLVVQSSWSEWHHHGWLLVWE